MTNWIAQAVDAGFSFASANHDFSETHGHHDPEHAPDGFAVFRVFKSDGQYLAIRLMRDAKGEWIK